MLLARCCCAVVWEQLGIAWKGKVPDLGHCAVLHRVQARTWCHLHRAGCHITATIKPRFMSFKFLNSDIFKIHLVFLVSFLCPQTYCNTCIDLLEWLQKKLRSGNATSPLKYGNPKLRFYVAALCGLSF